MNWLLIAVAAQIILGTSAVFDRMLLKRGVFDPFVYTFWFSMLGLFSALFLPFGFFFASITTIAYASAAGVFFTLAMLYLFTLLHTREAFPSLLLIGALTPITVLGASSFLLGGHMGIASMAGFSLLLLGGVLFFFSEEEHLRAHTIKIAAASALCFGIADALTKIVFEQSSFTTGFFLIKMGGVFTVILFLFSPALRVSIFSSLKSSGRSHHWLYVCNRWYAALGSVLVSAAIYLAHPAMVEATQALKYAVIFLTARFVLQERVKKEKIIKKAVGILCVVAGLLWLALVEYAHAIPVDSARLISWGLTFSQKASRDFGLDWRENFTAITTDLRPSSIRLAAYWDEMEKTRGTHDFTDTDWLVNASARNGGNIILAVGMKTPRWHECHTPEWAKNISAKERESALLAHLTAVILHYRNNPSITAWQVENEPYLSFGDCPERGDRFLENEIVLVKSLDAQRPVIVTDGGEFGRWHKAAAFGDIFGTTMYRKVHPRIIGPLFGPIEYPLAPSYFKLKEKIVRWIIRDNAKPFIVIELQGEPWGDKPVKEMTEEEILENFSPAYFEDTIRYAKETGFSEYYLWGAEWWYAMKLNGNPHYWDIARKFTRNQ